MSIVQEAIAMVEQKNVPSHEFNELQAHLKASLGPRQDVMGGGDIGTSQHQSLLYHK